MEKVPFSGRKATVGWWGKCLSKYYTLACMKNEEMRKTRAKLGCSERRATSDTETDKYANKRQPPECRFTVGFMNLIPTSVSTQGLI